MKSELLRPIAMLACVLALPALAQSTTPQSPLVPAQPVVSVPTLGVPVQADAAVAVVDAFSKALAAADFKAVKAMLDPDVIILESGGAERGRDEYLGHHAIADALFLGGAKIALRQRTARIDGNLAWVASESELTATQDGKPITLLSTETMVLRKTADSWHIVHIHWSSRPKKNG